MTVALTQLANGFTIATAHIVVGNPVASIYDSVRPTLLQTAEDAFLGSVANPLLSFINENSSGQIESDRIARQFLGSASALRRLVPDDLGAVRNQLFHVEDQLQAHIENVALQGIKGVVETFNLPVGIIELFPEEDRDPAIIYLNRPMALVSGHTPAAIAEVPSVYNYLGEDDRAVYKEQLLDPLTKSGGRRIMQRAHIKHASGQYWTTALHLGRVRGTNYVIMEMLDLNPVLQFEVLLQNTQLPLVLFRIAKDNVGYEPFLASTGFEELLGYDHGELKDDYSRILASLQPHQRETFANKLEAFLREGHFTWLDAEVTRKDGTTAKLDIKADLSTVNEQKFAIVFFSDARKREAAERDKMLAQRADDRIAFTRTIAHDSGNIMTPIMGYADAIKAMLDGTLPSDPQRMREYVEIIIRNVGAHTELMRKLRRQANDQSEGVDLQDILSTEEIKMLASQHAGPVTVNVQTSRVSFEVEGPAYELTYQILNNLITNAADAMQDSDIKHIDVETEAISFSQAELADLDPENRFPNKAAGRYMRLSITDTGSGIPDAVLAQMFEDGFSTKGVELKSAGGIEELDVGRGHGLHSVYQLVAKRGGLIAVKTQIGQGTTIDLYLPRYHDPAKSKISSVGTVPSVTKNANLLSPGNEVILIADDDEHIRNQLQTVLKFYEYSEVLVATDANEALRLAQENEDRLTAVVMDWRMPGITNDELVYSLKKLNPDLPIMVQTGAIPEHSPWRHAVSFIQKPWGVTDFAQELRAVIDGGVASSSEESSSVG